MKISYDILKKFVTPPKEILARELAETLTMSTVEVEAWESQADRLVSVVVGAVTKVTTHPNADKLKLVAVDCGKESLDVVCGGVNLKQGMKVAFAKIGSKVKWHGQGDWVVLEKAKIRGVESHGMICAAEELELSDSNAVEHGIMDLSHIKAKPGTPLAEALSMSDVVLDIDNKSITHRPDLWGHLGLARELAAVWSVPFTPAEPATIPTSNESKLTVTIKNPEKCLRYLGVVVGDIKISESPVWLKDSLTKLGARPINNVVDVTNYVMLELGQPMHAFDLSKLASADIIVRTAKKGEKIVTLDGVERKLEPETLVIADKKHAVAMAGIMGGQASEVSESTTHIVLESATFESVGVRKTATHLGLRTEASARFEKALDPNLAERALRRAVELLLEAVPGAKVLSPVVDTYPVPQTIAPIEFNLPWLMRRLGVDISLLKVQTILTNLGFKVSGKGETLLVTPPSWRATRDITIPEDLIEEVARIYGYGKIPLALPKFAITPPTADGEQLSRWKIRDALAAQGFTETLSYSFIGERGLLVLQEEIYETLALSREKPLELVNPVNESESVLRPALIPNVVSQLILNALHLPHQPIQMFELGRVFTAADGVWVAGADSGKLPAQAWHLALAVRLPGNDAVRTYQVLRGALDSLAEHAGVTFEFVSAGVSAARLMVNGKHVGGLALVQFMKSSLKPVVALLEINLEILA